MTEAYPLQWPSGWPRSSAPQRSKFGTFTFERARQDLLRELKLLRASNVVISSNLKLRKDGFPYSDQRKPDDTGIAVYFSLNGRQQCVPCDKWHSVEDNMRAIVLTIEALRGLERWGAKEMVDAAFQGFKALPAQTIVTPYTARPWQEVLEVSRDASIETIQAAYRSMLKKHHPDVGGDDETFMQVQAAWKAAKSEREVDMGPL